MTREEIFALFARREAAWRARDAAALTADHSQDGVVVSPTGGVLEGLAEIERIYRVWFTAFPDLIFTTEDLLVNGRVVAKVRDVNDTRADLIIEPLRVALKEQNDTSLRTTAQQDLADREVTIMGDKGTPFTVLKRVMATATAADYGKVSLAVMQKEVEAGAGA